MTDDQLDQLAKIGLDWTPCMKLPIVVHVRHQRKGETHSSTREGITPVLPTDLIMRGVQGEEYPIGAEVFLRTYTLDVAAPAAPAPDHSVDHDKWVKRPVGAPAQEPVAEYKYHESIGLWMFNWLQPIDFACKLYAAPPEAKPAQEPVAWKDESLRQENERLSSDLIGTHAVMEALRQKNERLRSALQGMLETYVQLVNCGDCGNWDPETETQVIAARAALKDTP